MNNLRTLANPFAFSNHDVRTAVDDDDTVWFCAKDVCDALDISWSNQTLQNMPDDCICMIKLIMESGSKSTTFIDESGLYRLMFRSNKPKATEFTTWVCREVLPTIRKNGFFGQVSVSDQIKLSKQIDELSAAVLDTRNGFRRKLMQDQLLRLCTLANQPVPPLEWISKSIDQLDMFLESDNG